jgi:Domain of unknown function (DUF4382)
MMELFSFARGRRSGIAAALGLSVLLSACGGGSSSDSGPTVGQNDQGTVMIGVTDADGDFLRYAVAVQSITLDRSDGATVETLPAAVTTDLAQFVDLTELFSAKTVPAGTYTAAHLRLDYSNADIAVEQNGEAVEANAVDADGNPLGVVDVDINFASLSRLVVRPNLPALLAIDFDLAASNSVDLTTSPPTVTAQPFLLASVNPADGKTLHVAGPLQSADASGSSYEVDLRPFHRHDGAFGNVTVQVSDSTTYEIDGTAMTGADGLAALAQLPADTPTLAEVTLNASDRALEAVNVLAGSSVPGADLDAVEGWVTSRDGDVVHVQGATLVRTSGELSFGNDVEVTLAPDVVVHEAGNPDAALDATAISVGQHVIAGGALNMDDPEQITLDASAVRLMETHVSGTVNVAQAGSLELSLDAIDTRAPSSFDYTGTGTSADMDADPQAYEVDTGSLTLANIAAGTPVRVFGMVMPFGAAPPDFQARTVEDVTDAAWRMDVSWPDGSTAAFASLEAGAIVLDLSDPALGVDRLRRGGVFTDLTTLPAAPSIVGNADGHGMYGIWQDHSVQVFLDYGRFVQELTNRMDGSTQIARMHAVGSYDEGSNSFAAQRLAVLLQ